MSQEAPADLKSNLTRAWATFSEETVAKSNKPTKFKACLFSLCFYHAIVLGRRRFGQQGWSKRYSFNTGDLTVNLPAPRLADLARTPSIMCRFCSHRVLRPAARADPAGVRQCVD